MLHGRCSAGMQKAWIHLSSDEGGEAGYGAFLSVGTEHIGFVTLRRSDR